MCCAPPAPTSPTSTVTRTAPPSAASSSSAPAWWRSRPASSTTTRRRDARSFASHSASARRSSTRPRGGWRRLAERGRAAVLEHQDGEIVAPVPRPEGLQALGELGDALLHGPRELLERGAQAPLAVAVLGPDGVQHAVRVEDE